jgi:hypothetical protein
MAKYTESRGNSRGFNSEVKRGDIMAVIDSMIFKLAFVENNRDIATHRGPLPAGSIGIVVQTYPGYDAFAVEFAAPWNVIFGLSAKDLRTVIGPVVATPTATWTAGGHGRCTVG